MAQKIIALIVAAGRGVRAGGGVPKQYRDLGGKPVLRRAVEAFYFHPEIDGVCVVIRPEDKELFEAAVGDLELFPPAAGGASRQQSVFNGLKALAAGEEPAPDIILIHDSARCFVGHEVIGRVIAAVKAQGEGAIPALAIADSLKRGATHAEKSVERDGLWRAQTPQGFPFGAILEAHEKATGQELSDDAAVAEAAGLAVRIVEGDEANIKLTREEDFVVAERRLGGGEMRAGLGFDVHRFEAGDGVVLCGVKIPFEKALAGHSDADVGLHALTDALLGAAGEGDIGDHFPPSDPAWKDAASEIFLKFAADRIRTRGGAISNLDITLICEEPRIGPYREQMRSRVAEILGIGTDRINIKATTCERLGFTGRGEGIAAQAVAGVRMPAGS